MSLWRHVEHDTDAELLTGTTGAMLAELHGLLAGCPVDLPSLAGPAHDIPTLLPRLTGRLDAEGTGLLHRAWERLADLTLVSLQPLHGDAHPGNLLATAAGPVWTDLEETCRGPREWDRPDWPSGRRRGNWSATPAPHRRRTCAPGCCCADCRSPAGWPPARPPVPGLSGGSHGICWLPH